ncbi:MAG: hypothetical protein C4321_04065, partial [Chloroflexota bacterium]
IAKVIRHGPILHERSTRYALFRNSPPSSPPNPPLLRALDRARIPANARAISRISVATRLFGRLSTIGRAS